MSSPDRAELWDVDFERHVPANREDVEALWRARSLPPSSDAEYLAWVRLMSEGHLREPWRDNTDDDPVFEL